MVASTPTSRVTSLASLNELFDDYHRGALGYAYRLVRDRADAEDVVLEAFLTVWRARAVQQRRHAEEGAWLLSLVATGAIRLLQARGWGRLTPAAQHAGLAAGGTPTTLSGANHRIAVPLASGAREE